MLDQSFKTVFLLGASSDIGKDLVKRYLSQGCRVIGTFRSRPNQDELPQHENLTLLELDARSEESIQQAVESYRKLNQPWDIFISGIGSLEPVGPFFENTFSEWQRSIEANAVVPLRILHELHSDRHQAETPNPVVFFAGGGVNNPVPSFSAYTASKLLLIKMCELLQEENPDLNVFILGPGWVRTKIHKQVLKAGEAKAGNGYGKTLDFMESGQSGTPLEDIYECIEWCIRQGKSVAGGRNFSVVHDPWKGLDGEELASRLRDDPNQFKLRRRGNEKVSQ